MAKSFENRWRWIFIWMTWFEVFGFWVLSAVGGLGFCLSGCEVLGFGDLVWWWVMSLPWWLVCCPKANFAWMYVSIFPKGDALPSLFPMWVFTLFPSLFGNQLVRRLLLRVDLDVRILSVWVMLRINFSHHILYFIGNLHHVNTIMDFWKISSKAQKNPFLHKKGVKPHGSSS